MFYDSFIHKNCRLFYAKGNDNLVVVCSTSYTVCQCKIYVYMFVYKNNFLKMWFLLNFECTQMSASCWAAWAHASTVLCCMACASCSAASETVNDSLQVCDAWTTLSSKCDTLYQPIPLSLPSLSERALAKTTGASYYPPVTTGFSAEQVFLLNLFRLNFQSWQPLLSFSLEKDNKQIIY